jgi:hypothetical protein
MYGGLQNIMKNIVLVFAWRTAKTHEKYCPVFARWAEKLRENYCSCIGMV